MLTSKPSILRELVALSQPLGSEVPISGLLFIPSISSTRKEPGLGGAYAPSMAKIGTNRPLTVLEGPCFAAYPDWPGLLWGTGTVQVSSLKRGPYTPHLRTLVLQAIKAFAARVLKFNDSPHTASYKSLR